MSMYAVNSNKRTEQYWDFEAETYDGPTNPGVYVTTDKGEAEDIGHKWQGHIIELTRKPTPVVVTQEEAKMLERAKSQTFRPSSLITSYSNDHGGWNLTSDIEDRLMRAYVNGWTVEPKRWNVKVPHVDVPPTT